MDPIQAYHTDAAKSTCFRVASAQASFGVCCLRMCDRSALFLLLCSFLPGAAQQPISDCETLKKHIGTFPYKFNQFRTEGPKATLHTVEQEFGKARLEPGTVAGSTVAVYALNGCVGKVLIDEKGIAWTANFSTVRVVASPSGAALEHVQSVEKRIRDIQTQLEGLQVLKTALVKQAAELPPSPPALGLSAASGATAAGDTLLAANRYDEAVQAYTTVVATSPKNA